jgi:uncharacterized Zn finger protein
MTNAEIQVAECAKCGADTKLHAVIKFGDAFLPFCPRCFEIAKRNNGRRLCVFCDGDLDRHIDN